MDVELLHCCTELPQITSTQCLHVRTYVPALRARRHIGCQPPHPPCSSRVIEDFSSDKRVSFRDANEISWVVALCRLAPRSERGPCVQKRRAGGSGGKIEGFPTYLLLERERGGGGTGLHRFEKESDGITKRSASCPRFVCRAEREFKAASAELTSTPPDTLQTPSASLCTSNSSLSKKRAAR